MLGITGSFVKGAWYECVIPSIIPPVSLFELDTFIYIIHYQSLLKRKARPDQGSNLGQS
jgi:hypothetical protein